MPLRQMDQNLLTVAAPNLNRAPPRRRRLSGKLANLHWKDSSVILLNFSFYGVKPPSTVVAVDIRRL